MNLKNKTKKILKTNNMFEEYKKIFATKQTRFLITKIIATLDADIKPEECAKLEMMLTKNEKDMFVKPMSKVSILIKGNIFEKADWKSLGEFLYFVFQTGVFYANKKTDTSNIYNQENYNKLNIEKKMLFNHFIESVKPLSDEHNVLIKNILRVVL
ncbi:hypothetical protein MYMA111404_04235 [Mycoplasma marinum]|uniref:Uncharacterized protein n=1 Tax=Mycoplasma marinum TaxID=1937190 RepID=A0A4R0XSP2_9MOLU|nr:hypothetical protein [Mycoplasma marinum]TCG10737.1 hypothetical protein C4B24_04085 [Mycoplasma marinum]